MNALTRGSAVRGPRRGAGGRQRSWRRSVESFERMGAVLFLAKLLSQRVAGADCGQERVKVPCG
jgi:hypothetical protein